MKFNMNYGYFYFYVLLNVFVSYVEMGFDEKPNILIMMGDDLGYGDIGCFGNTTLATPKIDGLAKTGVKLSHVLAASSVCSPSRAAFLTGRYPIRSGMAPHDYGVNIFVASSGGLPSTEITFAKLLKSSGYGTAIIGKWHLGLHCNWYGDNCHHPSNLGFDHFYGLPLSNMKDFDPKYPYRLPELFVPRIFKKLLITAAIGLLSSVWLFYKRFRLIGVIMLLFGFICPIIFYVIFDHPGWMNGIILRNDIVVEQPLRVWTLTKRFVHEAKSFIDSQQALHKPFMVFLSFTQVHTFLEVHPEFSGKSGHGVYGDCVQEVDWAVGQMVEFLKSRNIINNTLVLFTSDHGADIEDLGLDGQASGGRNGIFSGGKFMPGMEGGIRVPTIFSWPGKIPENHVINAPSSLMDVFPTLIHFAGANTSLEELSLDGKNLVPLLTGESFKSPHEFLFHYGMRDTIHSVTYVENATAVWKVHFNFPNWKPSTRLCYYRCLLWESVRADPPVIYNVITDPSESQAIDPSSDKYQEVLKKVTAATTEHRSSIEQVKPQLTSANVIWQPWLQPVCLSSSFSCKENIDAIL